MTLYINFMIRNGSRMISPLFNGSTCESPQRSSIVHCDGAFAADLWAALRQLFQDNVDARANNLHTKLRNTVQGDSPVGVYCQRLKAITDELRELGDPIDDRQLINVLLVGLIERFEKQASFIPMMRPLPSFAEVTVSRSSAEAEYRAVAHAVAETVWLRQLLSELHRPIEQATIV
nr:uncharacterized protein LOC120969926 [Aegilops tauschii subsp. strangulata]